MRLFVMVQGDEIIVTGLASARNAGSGPTIPSSR